MTVLTFEDVTVPSGTFTNAIKVQTLATATVITTVSGVRVTVSGTETVWLASGVGVVRRTSLIQGGGITESVTEELLRFVPTFRFSQVSAGVSHTCGVTITGKGYCWGRNDNGQLGNGTTVTSVSPVEVSGVLIFSYIGAGANHSCGLTITGQAYCWGAGFGGRLGNGAANDSIMPGAVSGGLIFTSISVFDRHTCGLSPSGQAYCWGFNESGQLGNGSQGTDASASVPVQVLGDIAFRSISAGSQHTCGVSITGQGFCWGNQDSGALGNGNLAPASLPTPQAVSGGLDFSSITTGGRFTCGITTIGQAYCWGVNYIGQLGNGNPPLSRGGPVSVTGGLSFISLDSGGTHSCGIANGGSTYCWGDNGSAALGNGTRISSGAPALVSGGIVFNSIQAGAQYTCGVDAVHGSLYCWGDPFDGKLGYLGGSGPTSPNIVPFPVSTPQ